MTEATVPAADHIALQIKHRRAMNVIHNLQATVAHLALGKAEAEAVRDELAAHATSLEAINAELSKGQAK